jgi:hypothetical protein
MERDENYIPQSRSYYGLPPETKVTAADYHEIFEETPLYTLGRMLIMQIFGLQLYFTFNTMGSAMYPKGTNVRAEAIFCSIVTHVSPQHFSPYSALFKDKERNAIVASDIGLSVMSYLLYLYAGKYGVAAMIADYFIPYLVGFCLHDWSFSGLTRS